MPSLKIRIPVQDLSAYDGDCSLPKAAKDRLATLLHDEGRAPPALIPSGIAAQGVTIWISEEHKAALTDLMRIYRGHEGIGPLATSLLHGHAKREHEADRFDIPEPVPQRERTTLDRLNEALGDQTRDAQAQMFSRLHKELTRSVGRPPVIAAEASTGIGKTRVFLASMLDWSVAHPTETAILTAPSYNVLLQSVAMWQRLRDALPETPDAVTILGQREFVSAAALANVLRMLPEDAPGKVAAAQWLAAGGTASMDDPLGHAWLMRSLQNACDGEWAYATEICVDTATPDDDPGRVAYQLQFKRARDTPWVFCTHAMLATDVRRRIMQARKGYKEDAGTSASQAAWAEYEAMESDLRKGSRLYEIQNDLLSGMVAGDAGRLPQIGLLIVDEAHMLEENFARLFATGISIAGLLRSLQDLHAEAPRKITAAELAGIKEAWSQLKHMGEGHAGEGQMADQLPPGAREAVKNVRTILQKILARKVPVNDVNRAIINKLREASVSLELAAQSNNQRFGMTTRVSWSPSEHWPSLEVGRYDIGPELDFLWTVMVQDRAVLVSATLYEDVSVEGLENVRRLLSIRSDRLRAMAPIRPPWTYEPVRLYLPANAVTPDYPKDQQRFYRPTERSTPDPDKLRIQTLRWRKEIAEYVLQAYESGEGGMLVLLTSHAEREALEVAIADRLPHGALISQTPARKHFLRATALGIRPCLLAVGAAWTGLDLSGDGLASVIGRSVSATDDKVLTDLVIPNAPIGANRTLTQQWRRQQTGVVAEIGAVSILFRQGIGRLVRREGLPRRSRRLHFLDARLYDPHWGSFFAPIKRALRVYGEPRHV